MIDLILVDGNVLTQDPRRPRAEAVAVGQGRIQAVGASERLLALKTSKTRVLSLSGQTVAPGFIDAHLHLRALAESLVTVGLGPDDGVASLADLKARIRTQAQALPAHTWIRASGYDENDLAEQRSPTRWDLDEAAPNHPVKLTHRSGHAHVLNSLALRMVGLSKDAPEPEGGLMERNWDTAEPSGLLYGLGDFLSRRVPPLTEDELGRGVSLAGLLLASSGVTSFQDASPRNDFTRWQDLERWLAGGRLASRVTMMLGLAGWEEWKEKGFEPRLPGDRLRPQGVKIVIDETTGRLNPDQETLNDIVARVHRGGGQAVLHAIEPTAIEAACRAVAEAQQRHFRPDPRHRIEHCSVCPPNLAARIAALGITVVTHPAFVYYNGDRYLRTVPPDDQAHLYPLAALAAHGVRLAAASDAPIVPPNPLAGLYAAVTRLTKSGAELAPHQAVSAEDALGMYTTGAAHAAFEEKAKGVIAPGRLADLVVLSADPTTAPAEDLKAIEVTMTIVGGEIVWSA
jgi:hypothetical protein